MPGGRKKGSGGTGGNGGTMVLTAYGNDATSSITGEPQEMPAMPGMAPQE